MAKLAILAFLAAFVAISCATTLGGVKDLAGNYYDYTTGQYSSSLTGRVYNSAPVAYAPHVVAAPAPYYYGSYPYGAAAYVAPVWK